MTGPGVPDQFGESDMSAWYMDVRGGVAMRSRAVLKGTGTFYHGERNLGSTASPALLNVVQVYYHGSDYCLSRRLSGA